MYEAVRTIDQERIAVKVTNGVAEALCELGVLKKAHEKIDQLSNCGVVGGCRGGW